MLVGLITLSPNDNISDQFEEILRHNNISDKDNAFIITDERILDKLLKKCDELNKKINSTNMTKKEYKKKLYNIFVDEKILNNI